MAKQLTEVQKKAKAKSDKARRAKAKVATDKAAKITRATKGTKAVTAPAPKSGAGRKVWGGQPLRDFAASVLVAKKRASGAAGSVGKLITEKTKEVGLNGPMFRLAMRLYTTAKNDPERARLDFDDLEFYFSELQIEKLCAPTLFKPREGAEDFEDDGDDEAESAPDETEGTTDLPDGVSRLDDHRDTAAA